MTASNKRNIAKDFNGEGKSADGKRVISAAKKHLVKVLPLLNATKIARNPTKKEYLDSFLFRCWQLGWLRDFDNRQPKYEKMRKALEKVKDAIETDVIWAPGASPTYNQVEKVRKVYKSVLDALGNRHKRQCN